MLCEFGYLCLCVRARHIFIIKYQTPTASKREKVDECVCVFAWCVRDKDSLFACRVIVKGAKTYCVCV